MTLAHPLAVLFFASCLFSAIARTITASSGATTYTVGDGPVIVDPGVTATDSTSSTFASAAISITSGFQSGDVLGFTNGVGIVGSYNAATGVLTLSGTSSLADYQTALASVTYTDTAASPTTEARTVNFSAFDGAVECSDANKTVDVNASSPVRLQSFDVH